MRQVEYKIQYYFEDAVRFAKKITVNGVFGTPLIRLSRL